METKNQERVVRKIQNRLKFPFCCVESPIGIAGGLALFWNDRVSLNIVKQNAEFIDMICEEVDNGNKIRITCLHASTCYQSRLRLCEELKNISSFNSLLWICVGDFNEVLYRWEKARKRTAEYYRMNSFREFLNDCSLMDLESKGCAFTWFNNREGEEFVKKRLDRAVCIMDWRLMFPEAEVFALPAIGSDHCPLLLKFKGERVKRKKGVQI